MKRLLATLCVTLFFAAMLLFPQAAFQGASLGVLLWFHTVLPTLLPFLIISNLLIHTGAINMISRILAPILCRFSEREARYLLSFCNNTSPMFIVSYIIWQNLKVPALTLPLLVILTAAPVMLSFVFRRLYQIPKQGETGNRKFFLQSPGFGNGSGNGSGSLDTCIMNGFETITRIGGYIILFSILISFAGLLPVKPAAFTGFFLPSLEITTGIPMICNAPMSRNMQIMQALALTSFGGWCAAAQTRAMIQGTSLPFLPYIAEKLITALATSLLVWLFLYL